MEEIYEIIDNDGVIHSGGYGEMKIAFFVMTRDNNFLISNGYASNQKQCKSLRDEWYCHWKGDLKFVKILMISR